MAHLVPVPFLAATVILLVQARFADNQRQVYLWKPISSALFILIALLSFATETVKPWYTIWITVGLLFGLGGDIALMLRSRKAFLIGLVLFLVGHIVYTVVWTVPNGFYWPDLLSGALLVVVAVVVFLYLRPGLGSMQVPVILYVIVICLMVNRAVSTFLGSYFTPTQAWLLTVGAVLFWLSDLMLAVNRFRRPFRREAYSLFLYYGGQALIALSASYF